METNETFEDAVKGFATDWANSGGTHSDEVVTELFSLLLEHFPEWAPNDKETKRYIEYTKRWQ